MPSETEHDGGRFTIEVAETLPQLQVKVDRGGEDRRYAIYTS